ncbi:hypothetical protein BDV10DRAFT_162412 [Aspergillus recurvatus]
MGLSNLARHTPSAQVFRIPTRQFRIQVMSPMMPMRPFTAIDIQVARSQKVLLGRRQNLRKSKFGIAKGLLIKPWMRYKSLLAGVATRSGLR